MDVDCRSVNERFVTQKRDMASQFADIYFVRLFKLKADLIEVAKSRWFSPESPVKICERILEAETGVRCILVGTIYKDMKLKPNILEELNREDPVLSTEGEPT